MIILSLNSDIDIGDNKPLHVVYNLTKANSLYGIECFIAGSDMMGPKKYSEVLDIASNEEFAIKFINKICENQVLPLNLDEIVQDCYPCSSVL